MKKMAMMCVLAMANESAAKNLESLIAQWAMYFEQHSWQQLITGYEPIQTGCGIVYELPNFLNRPDEGLAIVDMRQLSFAEPHYHPDNCYEIYFVLQGSAIVVIGGHHQQVHAGDVVIIPPNKSHFTIPDREYVIGVINTPPYTPESYVVLNQSDAIVEFDYEQFKTFIERE